MSLHPNELQLAQSNNWRENTRLREWGGKKNLWQMRDEDGIQNEAGEKMIYNTNIMLHAHIGNKKNLARTHSNVKYITYTNAIFVQCPFLRNQH